MIVIFFYYLIINHLIVVFLIRNYINVFYIRLLYEIRVRVGYDEGIRFIVGIDGDGIRGWILNRLLRGNRCLNAIFIGTLT
jgi:hypothetical protein